MIIYGSKSNRPDRIAEIEQLAKSDKVMVTAHEMKDTGHAFPATEYPFVTDWIHNVVMKDK
jgi:predicted esterase